MTSRYDACPNPNDIRMSSCTYITAMGLLIANDLCNLEHDETQLDSQLIDAALLWLNEAVSRGPKGGRSSGSGMCVSKLFERCGGSAVKSS